MEGVGLSYDYVLVLLRGSDDRTPVFTALRLRMRIPDDRVSKTRSVCIGNLLNLRLFLYAEHFSWLPFGSFLPGKHFWSVSSPHR